MDLVRRALGALPDAAWLRRQFTADAEVVHDVRHGARMLRKSPTFTAAAVATLALGIGGTVAMATLLDTLFFRALPYADAERIVTLWQRPSSGEREDVAPANFLDWRERNRSFDHVAAAIPYSYDYTGAGEPEVLFGAQITEGFWEALGVRPALGRAFRPDEHARGSQPVAIITHGLWQRRFGGDPSIVNRAISLDGASRTVVGVLPADFKPQLLARPGERSVWTPKVIQEHEKRIRGSAWWNVVGRLKPGVTREQAQAEMTSIAAALAREHPATSAQQSVEVLSLREHLMGDLKLPLLVLLAAVALVLMIGCTNVASLLLARGIQREREFAIRTALGAGRGRLVRQLVVESLLLSGIAAVVGVGIAQWMIGAIVALAPAGVLRLQDAAIDARMLLFAALVTTAAAVAFGVLPALQFSRPGRDAMRERQASAPRGSVRRALVALEIALAVVSSPARASCSAASNGSWRLIPVSRRAIRLRCRSSRTTATARRTGRAVSSTPRSSGCRRCRAWKRPAPRQPCRSRTRTSTSRAGSRSSAASRRPPPTSVRCTSRLRRPATSARCPFRCAKDGSSRRSTDRRRRGWR